MTKLHFYKNFDLCFSIFQICLRMQKTLENITKSAENANLPGIPIKTQGFLLKPGKVTPIWIG